MSTDSSLAYVSFDSVPAAKGAAVHISAFSRSLARAFGTLDLVTVAGSDTAVGPDLRPDGVRHTALPALGTNLIGRALHFRARLAALWQGRRFTAVQFRSIFEGFPIVQGRRERCDRLVFEVNGLPSIELKYRYPRSEEDRTLMAKIRAQEHFCLMAADLVITPSAVTAEYLQSLGVSGGRLRVIPNGVDLECFSYRPPQPAIDGPMRLVYFGTLAPWQGVELAVRALARLPFAAHLELVGHGSHRQVQFLRRLADKLHVGERVHFAGSLSQSALVARLHASDAVVAPFALCDRNLVQGCCPLKVLEGMASGTPVVSTDLPVVRALGADGEHLLLARPGSVDALVEALTALRTNPALGTGLARAARRRIEEHFTWEQAGRALVEAYTALGIQPVSRF